MSENPAKFIVSDLFFYAGAGIGNGVKIVFIGENRWVERPLGASPWSAVMHRASGFIEDTMAVESLHLYNLAGQAPKILIYCFFGHVECLNHSLPVFCIQRNRGLAVTTGTASFTGKYPGHFCHELLPLVMADFGENRGKELQLPERIDKDRAPSGVTDNILKSGYINSVLHCRGLPFKLVRHIENYAVVRR